MSPRSALCVPAVALACAAGGLAVAPAPASALNPVGTLCGVTGFLSGAAGKACKVIQGGAKLLSGGKKAAGAIGGASTVGRAAGIAAIGAWVLVGAKVALDETAKIISHTTSPQLGSTWFSSTYWRMSGIAAILTLPFLFAAAVQALMRSDLAMLTRAALVQLPLAVLGVSLAAPLTMLMLAATDQMSAILASASGHAGTRFLSHAGLVIGGLAVIAGAPFIAFVVGLFTVAGAVVLWLELLMREAAVYVVVLMLPLAFASFVWPARRVWAVRAVELLVALILSKFVIVAVLALGGAALGQGHFSGVTGMLAGTVLVTMGAFAPWALIRLLPLAELAGGAAGSLRGEAWKVRQAIRTADEYAGAITPGARRQGESPDGDGHDGRDGHDGAAVSAARAETERLADLAELPAATGAPGGGGWPDGGPGGGPGGPGGNGPGGGGPGGGAAGGSGGRGSGGGGSGGGGSGGGGHGDDGGDGGRPRGERLPGLGPAFQMANGEWPPLVLGPDPDRRPVVRETPQRDPAALPPAAGSELGSSGEDHDPRPPEQDPDEGRL